MSRVLAALAALLLSACAPAITDSQVNSVVSRCKDLGMSTRVFNSMLVSTAECVEVKTK